MASKCKLTKGLISEKVYSEALDSDNNVIVLDNKIIFSSKESFENFKKKMNTLFDIQGIGHVMYFNEDTRTAAVDDTSILEEMDAFEEPSLVTANVSVSTPEYHADPKNVQFYNDYKMNMNRTAEKMTLKIKNLREDFKNATSYQEQQRILKEMKQYYVVRNGVYEQVEKIEKQVPNMTAKLEEAKSMLEYILQNFGSITNPHLIETVNGIFEEVDSFSEMLGDPKYASKSFAQILSATDTVKLRNLRDDIKRLHLSFERLLDEQSRKYLSTNPILLSDAKMREILSRPDSDEYKKMFGGAAIADINFLEKLGLNVDTSSTFDGVLGQLLTHEFDRIAQDIMNDVYDRKKKFMSIAKKMKSIGINMESAKDMDFIFEKDKNGNRTGRIASVFSFSFKETIRDFSKAIREKKTGDVTNMIRQKVDFLDFMKLSFIHQSRDEIMREGGIKAEFYSCCEKIFKETTGRDSGFREYLDSHSQDSDYEIGIKKKLGEKMFNEMCEDIMTKVIEYYYSNQGSISNTQHKNPFMILKRAKEIKTGASADSTFNNKMYRFNILNILPAAEEGYNQDFRSMFIESEGRRKEILDEFYDFVYDNYTLFGLLYNNKDTLRAAFLKDNAADMMADAVKGIARFDDVSSNMRKLKNGMKQWFADSYWDDNYIASDSSSVALNYSDTAEKRYYNILEAFKIKPVSEIDEIAANNGIKKSDYENDEKYKEAIARKISLQGYNDNFYEVTMRMFDLYAAQKARNEMYPVAKTIERLYSQYTNEKGHSRANAMERMRDNIQRSIQKIKLDDDGKLDYKISNISFVRNFLSKFDSMPLVNKFLNTSLMKKLSEDEKELVEMIQKAKEDIDGDTDIEFVVDDVKYKRSKSGGVVGYYKSINGEYLKIQSEDEINDFKNKMAKYYDNKLAMLGSDATLQNVANIIRNLLMYKMLAGISTSGIFNRIEGHLANSEMDATGYYWTPGNLNFVEQYFLGAGLLRFITKTGEKAIVKLGADEESKWIKRLDIVRKISERTNIFQDMKNQFDKTIEGAQKGVFRHNFDLFQLSVNNPEFKNQMSVALAMLIDVKIKDNNGNIHHVFDKKTGEFTCFDIKDGELVLKPEFDNENNRNWITFQSTVTKTQGGNTFKVTSPSFEFAQKCKVAIKNIHGDYRKNTALGYTNNVVLSHIMMLRRWLPSKVMRGWSEGGGETANYELMAKKYVEGSIEETSGQDAQRGLWRDALEKGRSPLTMMLPMVLSTFRLHKGILKTLVGAGGSVYFISQTMKNKLGAKRGEIEHNVSMLEETVEMFKALGWELMTFVPRNVPRVFGNTLDFDASHHSFTDPKFANEYGEITLGNFRACARQMATYFYIAAIGVAAKLLFWNPDDGDDDDRRKMYNWMDNNLENILSSMTSTLFMIENIEDKFEVSNLPIIRLSNDMIKFVKSVNEMNGEKIVKYGEKVFVPIRMPFARNKFNPFESDYEYEKDTWDDRWIKNIKTDDEWGSEQTYKNVRADIKKQYVDMWNREKLPQDIIDRLAPLAYEKGYEDIYQMPESTFKDIVSQSTLIPSRKQKIYKDMDYKHMRSVLLDEYENNPYLKNHSLRYIFGGYNNRLKNYFQRDIKGEVYDNPYIDDGD